MRITFAGEFNKNDVINIETENLTDIQLIICYQYIISDIKIIVISNNKNVAYYYIDAITKMERIAWKKRKRSNNIMETGMIRLKTINYDEPPVRIFIGEQRHQSRKKLRNKQRRWEKRLRKAIDVDAWSNKIWWSGASWCPYTRRLWSRVCGSW